MSDDGKQVPSDDALAALIDQAMLEPEAGEADIVRICHEAMQHGFAAVCVNPCYVRLAAETLRGSRVPACTAVGFPLGANVPATKAFEATRAIEDGAKEIDMVLNIGALKSARHDRVRHDIEQVVNVSRAGGAIVKVILETALLTDEEKIVACEISRDGGADFVKTSTGFGPGGATASDVALLSRTVGEELGVKASGGIDSRDAAIQMVAAGATRIGTSAGVRIVQGQ